MAVERLRNCEDVRELARELGVTRRCLYKWRTKLEVVEPGEEASRPSGMTIKSPFQIRRKCRNPCQLIPGVAMIRFPWGGTASISRDLKDWLYQNRLAGR